MSYKRGDKVKIVGTGRHNYCSFVEKEHIGHEATVNDIYNNEWGQKVYVQCTPCDSVLSSMPDVAIEPLTTNQTKKDKTMSISQDLRTDKLDDDTKLLIEQEIINLDGTLTDEGSKVVRDYAFALTRDKILADLRKRKAEVKPADS